MCTKHKFDDAKFSGVPCGLNKLLEETFRGFGGTFRVKLLLEQGAEFSGVPCGLNKLLEDTFRGFGDTFRVKLLLKHGADFSKVPCGLNKLLEETFRERGDSFAVKLLLEHGADFSKVPSGLNKLLEETFREFGGGFEVEFLLEQGAEFSKVPCGLNELLEDAFREDGDSFEVEFLLEQDAFSHLPCNFNAVIKDQFQKAGSVETLLKQASIETLFNIIRHIRSFQANTEVEKISAYELDGVNWPKVIDEGPVRFLTTSIAYLKDKFSNSTDLETQDGTITACRTMLSAQSPYFERLFDPKSGFVESAQVSFKVQESKKTMAFIIYYGETEPYKVDWSPFCSSYDFEEIAQNLDSLLAMLRAAEYFGMMQLHKDVQRQIVIKGHNFISPDNVEEIQEKAEMANGKLLSSYCIAFCELNEGLIFDMAI